MERGSLEYVTCLEQYIHLLQQILQEWTPYVPHEVLLKHQPSIKSIRPNIAPITRRLLAENSSSPQIDASRPHQDDINCSSSISSEPKKEAWRQSLDTFIQKIPPANEWARKTEKLDQRTGEQADNIAVPRPSVLDSLLSHDSLLTQGKSCVLTDQLEKSDIHQTLESYSARVRERNVDAQWYKLVASYEKFVLTALAHVVSFKNVEPKFVDKMMEHVSDGRSSGQLRELRRGVSWAVQATSCLHERGWDIRSGDIMFYFPPTFKALKIWGKSRNSLETLITALSTKKYTQAQGSFEVNQLHMPCILKCIVHKNILLSDICKCLNSNFDIARKIFFDWYLQPYGLNAMDDEEARALCFPITRLPRRDDVPDDQGERARKRRCTRPETNSPFSTSDRSARATGIEGNISASQTSLPEYGSIPSYIDETSMGSQQHPPSNTDFWSVVDDRASDGASSHDRRGRSVTTITDGNAHRDDPLRHSRLEGVRSMQDPGFASPPVDDINLSAEPRIFVPADPGGPLLSDRNDVTDDPTALDEIDWSAEPRFFVPTGPGDPHNDRNDDTDDPTALFVDEIDWSTEPRFFVPTGPGDPHNDRNDDTDDPTALDEIDWSAEPRFFVPTGPGGLHGDRTDFPMNRGFSCPKDAITASGGPQNIGLTYMDGYPVFDTPRQPVEAALEA